MTNEYKIEYIQRKNDVMDFLNQSIQVMEALEKRMRRTICVFSITMWRKMCSAS